MSSTVNDKMVKDYVLMSRKVFNEHGRHVIPIVQCGKFFEVYDLRDAESSRLLSLCERLLYLKVTRKQKLTVELMNSDEVDLVASDGQGRLPVQERLTVYAAGFQVESIKKYRDTLIEKGYSILPVVQTGCDNRRTVCAIESAAMHTGEASSGIVLVTDDSIHVARYDANLNAIGMVERQRASDLQSALDEARSIVSELGGCSELEVHALESDETLSLAVRNVFVGGISAYARPIGKRRKFLCDRRWLRRALETHYTWITRMGDDVIAKLGMRETSIHHIAALVLLVAFLTDHDAQIGEVLPVPNVRSNDGVARVMFGSSTLHIFDAPVSNGSLSDVLSNHIHTVAGKRALRERLASPSTNANDIRAKLVDIRRGFRIVEEAPTAEQNLRGMRDLEQLSCKLICGRLVPSDVSKLIDAHTRAARILAEMPDPALLPATESVRALQDLTEYMIQTFDDDDPSDVFKKDATAPDDIVFARKCYEHAEARAEETRKRYMSMLDGSLNVTPKMDAVTFQVKNGQTDVVTSHKLATLLKDLGCKVRTLSKDQCAIEDDEARAAVCEWDDARNNMRQVHDEAFSKACMHMRCAYFDAHGPAIAHTIGKIDMLRGLAIFFQQANYHAPDIHNSSEGCVVASALRHPLGERLVDQRGFAYVPNDICIDAKHGWLVYGVNSAGKSSLLKAIALAVLMAQCGLYVPATSMSIAPYETIALHIGGSDDIFRHQSTFVKELEQLRCVLRASVANGPRLLFLADELGNSTEDASAVKLVASLLHTLVHRHTTVALATHMFALQSNPFIQGLTALQNKHLAVTFDAGDVIVFERKLCDGLPEMREYGCRIARLMLREDNTMVSALSSDFHTVRANRAITGSSRYNREAIAQVCDICGHHPMEQERPLQWHHIGEQHEADAHGILPTGVRVHAYANLARVCENCHGRLHHGDLTIREVRETDRGRVFIVDAHEKDVRIP